MGYLFEELIRRFSELSNETAGEHFTPREVIRLMVNLLFIEDDDAAHQAGRRQDACSTRPAAPAACSRVAEDHLRSLQPAGPAGGVRPGAERRDLRHLPLRHDDQGPGRLPHRASATRFSEDGFAGEHFDYMLANPPFGVEWKKVETAVRDEHESKGFAGRFGAGLPRINDGSFLFLQHMISKMKPAEQGGSRLAIVFNGSPLFTGGAGSGESRSAAGSSRTTGSRPSSPCPTSCSTTPASPPTSGSSPTARRPSAAARCS